MKDHNDQRKRWFQLCSTSSWHHFQSSSIVGLHDSQQAFMITSFTTVRYAKNIKKHSPLAENWAFSLYLLVSVLRASLLLLLVLQLLLQFLDLLLEKVSFVLPIDSLFLDIKKKKNPKKTKKTTWIRLVLEEITSWYQQVICLSCSVTLHLKVRLL